MSSSELFDEGGALPQPGEIHRTSIALVGEERGPLNGPASGPAVARADLVEMISSVLNGFTATQHLSPNHIIEFDAADRDRAICYSYTYAQHLLEGAQGAEFYLLRGSYRLLSAITGAVGRDVAAVAGRTPIDASTAEREFAASTASFRDWRADIPAVRRLHPALLDFDTWLVREGKALLGIHFREADGH